MATNIHKTAVVNPKAKFADNITVGPYSVIDGDVTISENVTIGSSCVITGNTSIGKNCQFFTGAVIGSTPQDKKFNKFEKVFLSIGEGNIFREYITVNPGTGDGGKTIIGNDNLLMAYSHVAHDCILGDECVMANSGTLAGHVTLEDKAVIGGLTAIHQFVRLGKLSIVGGCSKVVQDIPPFSMCDGHPARVYGLNSIGLKRAQISRETVTSLKRAFKILFQSGLTKARAIEEIEKKLPRCDEVDYLVNFAKTSQRGLCS